MGTSLRTNGPLSVWVVLLCHVVGTLIFKVGFMESQRQGNQSCTTELTLASYGK